MGSSLQPMVIVPDRSRQRAPNPDMAVVRQIDELQSLAKEERNKRLGGTWFEEIQDFYDLTGYSTVASPSFRPRIVLPELQMLMLAEATDISESVPRVFITYKSKRDEQREVVFQHHWRQQQYNLSIFIACIWSLFCGTSFLQVGFDPYGRRGKGEVWLLPRDPSTVFPDPGTVYPKDWIYVIVEDRMYLDDICRRWPQVAPRLRRSVKGVISTEVGTPQSPGDLELPEGPMRYGSGGPVQKNMTGDGRLVVRHTFIRDFTTVELSNEQKKDLRDKLGPLTPVPEQRPMYPNGRWITDCQNVILADGDFYLPFGKFGLIPVQSMPRLHSFWVPPPVRYTKALQELQERLYTGLYENAVRMNNGIWFIDENTGITADDFGGIPAEVRIINANSRIPQAVYPSPMPQHYIQLPEILGAKQRAIQGFTGMRQGEPQPGNISQSMYDATVFQSQVLTRMRAKLLAPAMQEVAEDVFYAMCRYYVDDQVFPGFGEGEMKLHRWTPISGDLPDYDIFLEPGSIRPLSSSTLRSMILAMLEKGIVPLKYGLEQLDFPHAAEVAEEQRQQMELAALAKLKRPR